MKQKNATRNIKLLLLIILLISIFLYLTGLYTGFRFTKEIERTTTAKIEDLVVEMAELNTKLTSMRLFESFMRTLPEEEFCLVAPEYMRFLITDLEYYWDILPYRLEEYERYNELSKEYLALKQQYTQALIFSWSNMRYINRVCDLDTIHVLYFYSSECDYCVEQGEQLDVFKERILDREQNIVIYTVDFHQEEPVLHAIKRQYAITEVPAILLGNTVLQGRVYTGEELYAQLSYYVHKENN